MSTNQQLVNERNHFTAEFSPILSSHPSEDFYLTTSEQQSVLVTPLYVSFQQIQSIWKLLLFLPKKKIPRTKILISEFLKFPEPSLPLPRPGRVVEVRKLLLEWDLNPRPLVLCSNALINLWLLKHEIFFLNQ